MLWRTPLDYWEDWSNWNNVTGAYTISPLKLPDGDLDGDGIPEVIAQRSILGSPQSYQRAAGLGLRALSGRTGRELWSSGGLPYIAVTPFGNPNIKAMAAYRGDHRGGTDLYVRHLLLMPGSAPPLAALERQSRIARLSGRDGRVVWDVLLVDYRGQRGRPIYFDQQCADLDGDGALELVVPVESSAPPGIGPLELRVLSAATGETRWSDPLGSAAGGLSFVIGDLQGDGHSDVILGEQLFENDEAVHRVAALDSATGKPRWVWQARPIPESTGQRPALCLADFDGRGSHDICVGWGWENGRIEVIDAAGKSRSSCEMSAEGRIDLAAADLDGDGRDELLVRGSGRLRALRADLTELWSMVDDEPTREILPASSGGPATVVLNRGLGLDGKTGTPIWSVGKATAILPAADGRSLPRALEGPEGSTVCRMPLPMTAQGTYAPALGVPARPASPRDDPRWERRLPWAAPVEPFANPVVQLAFVATLLNICIPWSILWLATRRRFFSVRLLLAMPAAVAFALTGSMAVIKTLQSQNPPGPGIGYWIRYALLLSLGGLPIVAFAYALGSSVIRRRFRKVWFLVAGAGVAAIVIAASMLGLDQIQMGSIEHYAWSGWHQAVYCGFYAVGALVLLSWPVRWSRRRVVELARRCRAVLLRGEEALNLRSR